MRFTKIKATEEGVYLEWTTKSEGAVETVKREDSGAPLESFPLALQAFKPYVIALIGAPKSWEEDLRVTGISLNEEKDNRRGLIVTAVRPIAEASGRVLVINTPLMKQRGENTSETASGVFEDHILKKIAEVEREALGYRKGNRAQIDAFTEGKGDDTAAATGDGSSDVPAGDDPARKRRKKKEKEPETFVRGVGQVMNPEATVPPPEDEELRRQLVAVGRDVPLDAIARWTSTERAAALAYALKPRSEEPDVLKRDATPAMFDNMVEAQGEQRAENGEGHSEGTATGQAADGWTQETPPPKADAVAAVQP